MDDWLDSRSEDPASRVGAADRAALSRIWSAGVSGDAREELGDVLRFQLGLPVPGGAVVGEPAVSTAELLRMNHPPEDLLLRLKEFAKGAASDDDTSTLPHEVARVLYLAAIYAALLRRGLRITGLDDVALGRAGQRVLTAGWLDEPTAQLFRELVNKVGGRA